MSRTLPGPEPILLYQSGIEFLELTAKVPLTLRHLIASLDRPPDPA